MGEEAQLANRRKPPALGAVRRAGGVARAVAPTGSGLGERLHGAWQRHPLVTVVRLRRRLVFCRSLLSAVKAGLPISTVFSSTWRGAGGGQRLALARAGERLREGASLAQALEEVRELVDPVSHALLSAAEQSGRLQQLLERRIAEMEETRELVWHIVKMAAYPMYLLAGLIFVGPLLSLPGAAAAGTCTSALGQVYLTNLFSMLLRVSLGLGLLLSLPFWVAALKVSRPVDVVLLHSPLFGPLLRDGYGARLAVGLSAALGGGLEVVRAMRLAAQGTSSPWVQGRISLALDRLAAGGNLTDAVAELGVLDGASLEQVAMAERTGDLENSLAVVGRELRQQVARRARTAVFVILGLLVASLLATVVIKMLGVIFGPIMKSYQLDNLDRL